MSTHRVIVSVPGLPSAALPELRTAGLRVTETLEAVGAVRGEADDDAIAALESLPGVSVAPDEEEFQLPPLDEPQ
ncbi:hypothetical protein [Salana multivorans]